MQTFKFITIGWIYVVSVWLQKLLSSLSVVLLLFLGTPRSTTRIFLAFLRWRMFHEILGDPKYFYGKKYFIFFFLSFDFVIFRAGFDDFMNSQILEFWRPSEINWNWSPKNLKLVWHFSDCFITFGWLIFIFYSKKKFSIFFFFGFDFLIFLADFDIFWNLKFFWDHRKILLGTYPRKNVCGLKSKKFS